MRWMADGQPLWHKRFGGGAGFGNASRVPNAALDPQMAAVEWNMRAMVTNCPQLESMLPGMKATPVSFVVESPKKLKMTVDMAT